MCRHKINIVEFRENTKFHENFDYLMIFWSDESKYFLILKIKHNFVILNLENSFQCKIA